MLRVALKNFGRGCSCRQLPSVFRSSYSTSHQAPATLAGQAKSGKTVGLLVGFVLGAVATSGLSALISGQPTPESKTHGQGYGSMHDFQVAVEELRRAFSGEGCVSTEPSDLSALGSQAPKSAMAHGIVVRPKSTEEVQRVVLIAKRFRIPLLAHGSGTSLAGQANPVPDTAGICVDLAGMDRILAINEADSDLVCQPGTRWNEINSHLQDLGIPLFFPLDPGPGASIGGLISTGCSGTNAVRYGTARSEWILNVTVVLPSGKIITTRSRARKSSAGFDLTKLFIGAEGTLGIITEVTLRLAPVVPTTVATVQFPDVGRAVQTVITLLNKGVPLQCAELLDSVTMHSINLAGGAARKYDDADALFLKIQNPTPAIFETVRKTCLDQSGTHFTLAKTPEEADALWADRKNAYFSNYSLMPGARGLATDICVPVSRLPQFVLETKADFKAHGIVGPIVGHVGDGNFHALILYRTPEQEAAAHGAEHRMVKRALALGGTCTGEHGVGTDKKQYLVDELGVETVELMKAIKRTLDPDNLFNPGKLYP